MKNGKKKKKRRRKDAIIGARIYMLPIGKRYLQDFYGLLIKRFIHCWNGVKKGKRENNKRKVLEGLRNFLHEDFQNFLTEKRFLFSINIFLFCFSLIPIF